MATINGTSANETLIGTAGDDVFVLATGGSGDNNGHDTYDGLGGHDTILGGWSHDVLHVESDLANLNSIEELDGAGSSNTILATTGDDTLDFSGIVVKNFTIDGAGGNDTITGTGAGDAIRGGTGNDTLNGGAGNDTFFLLTGNDINGVDQYNGGDNTDRIVGGWSYDTLNVLDNLSNLASIEQLDGGDITVDRNTILGTTGDDTLNFSDIAVTNFTIHGNDGDDTITGTDDADRIKGGDGDDSITGGKGDDTLFGGDGNDTFRLLEGDVNGLDQYDGGAGTDTIRGGYGWDTLHVTSNLSNLVDIEAIDGGSYSWTNTILATTGDDTLDFSGIAVSNFVIDGGDGEDTITGGTVDDHIRGGTGDDTLSGGTGNDTFLLLSGDVNGHDQYDGGAGNDRILGSNSGYDTLHVTNGLTNLVGIEVIDGNSYSWTNTILATNNHDTLDFSDMLVKNFVIDGLGGNDVIDGGTGDDYIRGNSGGDTMDGHEGSDTYYVGAGDGTDRFLDSGTSGYDTIVATDNYMDVRIREIAGIEEISSAQWKNGLDVLGHADHQNLDFSNVKLVDIGMVDALGGNDTIHTSNDSNAANGQAYRGGQGGDHFILGTDDTRLFVSAADSGYDTFSGNNGFTHTVLAQDDGMAIRIGQSYQNDVDEITANGHADVTVVGSSGQHNVWDLSATELNGIVEVATGGGNDTIHTSNDSDAANGQAYRGGTGGDSFILGSDDTRLLYASADNGGYDSFSGNGSATHTAIVEDDNTVVGIGLNYGGTESVDVIDATGMANASIVGKSSHHNVWDLSGTELINISEVSLGGGNDHVQSALASGNHITYDGGAYSGDALTISLTAAQAGNATLMSQIAALTPGPGTNGVLNAGGVDMTLTNWENFSVAVEVGGSFQPLNIMLGTSNHDRGAPWTPALTVTTDVDESWSIFGFGGQDLIQGGDAADFIDGGGGYDWLHGGGGDDTFFVANSSPANHHDEYDGGTGDDTIVSGDGADILARTLVSIEEINGGGFVGVDLLGSAGLHENFDLSNTRLRGIEEVSTFFGNDTIHTSNDSDATGGQAYRGGEGADHFLFGTQDTRLFVSSADNGGRDSFSDNGAATHTLIVEDDNTQVGLGASYGGTNSVDEIDAGGNANVDIVGGIVHNHWDFSGTTLTGIDEIIGGDATSNDVITGSSAADTIKGLGGTDRLDGGGGGIDTLSGGDGADLFVFADAGNVDHVLDFSHTEGDAVFLGGLLDDPSQVNSGNIGQFAGQAVVSGDTQIYVDADGGADNYQHVATLDDYTGDVFSFFV